MKSIAITILSFLLIMFSSCKDSENSIHSTYIPPTNTSGFNCSNGSCIYVESNAQYKTLSECQNSCKGYVAFKGYISDNIEDMIKICPNGMYKIKIGIAYSSTDAVNNAFFDTLETESNWIAGSFYLQSKYILDPGVVYYYKITKVKKKICGNNKEEIVVTQNGSFSVKAPPSYSETHYTEVNIGKL